jgi:hypothetical protein
VSNLLTFYTRFRPATTYAKTRDFNEKVLYFKDENRKFIYKSSLPDVYRPIDSSITRAYTIMEFMVFE